MPDYEILCGEGYDLSAWMSPVMDYNALREQGYEILNENILENPVSVYENPWLCGQKTVTQYIEKDKEYQEKGFALAAMIDYFCFDLNDDGTEEYIVSVGGPAPWGGSDGNLMMILERSEEGDLEIIFSGVKRIYNYDEKEYLPVCILENEVNGYHLIAFPGRYEDIWWYSAETGRYEAGE